VTGDDLIQLSAEQFNSYHRRNADKWKFPSNPWNGLTLTL